MKQSWRGEASLQPFPAFDSLWRTPGIETRNGENSMEIYGSPLLS
jgi:hypothetical protein